ncbi:Rhs family protein, partial [mine drainage metagenome]
MIVTKQPRDTQGNVIRTTKYYFDMLDRPLYRTDTLMDGLTVWSRVQNYDSLGRIASTSAPYTVGGTSPGLTTYSYDVLNRVTKVQRPTSASDSTPATWSYQYNGLREVVTNPNGESRTLDWDPNGWLRESTDDLGYTVTFGYDAAGDENDVTDNEGNTLWTGTYAYGIRPFLIGETSMDRGAWGFSVDALGERTAWTDAKGQQFFESYDALSRPVTLSEPDLFTQWTWGSSASAHNVGQLAGVCTGTGTNPTGCSSSGESEAWTYDSDGRLSTRTITLPNSGSYTYTWQYSPTTGLLSSLTYPGTATVAALTLQYGYAYGYLQSITDTLDSPNIVVWTANQMNPDEQITQDTLGNGIVTTRTYDAVTHLLTAVQSGVGGGAAVQNQGFLYDPDGNLVERQDNDLGMTENFYYDGDNRLSYSTLNGNRNLTVTYNAMGDITSRSDVLGGGRWTYDPNRKHEVTQISSAATPPVTWTYAYDANGNMTSGPGRTITWTSYNYPSEIDDAATGESVSFNYGPFGKPWLETTQEPSGTSETYRIGKLMDIVVSGSGTEYRDYIYAGNAPVAVDDPGTGASGFHYFQTDPQGSIAEITNGSGQLSVNESFTAFGALRDPATWSGSPTSGQLATITGITQHAYTFQRMLGEQM